MIFISLILCTSIFYLYRSRENILLDPFTLFFVGTLYYGFLIPVCMVVFNDYLLPFERYGLVVSDQEIDRVALLLFLGYASFSIAYRLMVPIRYVDNILHDLEIMSAEHLYHAEKSLKWLCISLFVLGITLFSDQILDISSGYQGKIDTRYDASTFGLIFNLFMMTLCAYAVTVILFKDKYVSFALAIVTILFMLSLLLFSKEPMLYAAIVMFGIAARSAPRNQLMTFAAALCVASLLLLFIVPSFSAYRSTGMLTFRSPADMSLGLLFSDANGPFSSVILAVRGQTNIYLGPLYESFTLWIPRSIWTERPLDAAEEYARSVMADWQPGFGLGFSPFAEAHIRYSLWLSPILFFVAGLFMAGAQRIVSRRLPAAMVPGLILIVQGYTLFITHRGAFSGLVTAMAQFWIPFFAILLLSRYVLNPTSEPREQVARAPSA